MSTSYFSNAVGDTIGVNLNQDVGSTRLNPRTLTSAPAIVVNLQAAEYPIGPNKDKGKLGTGSTNKLSVNFATLRSTTAYYQITFDSRVSGSDLYFYVFENTLVGQDATGRSQGITIETTDSSGKVLKTDQNGD